MTRYLKQSYLPLNNKTLKSYTTNPKNSNSNPKLNMLITFFYFLVFTLPMYCRTVYITESLPQAIEVPDGDNCVQIDLSTIPLTPHQTQYRANDSYTVYDIQPDLVAQSPMPNMNPPIYTPPMPNVNPPIYTHESHYTPPVNNGNQEQLVACSVDRIVGDVKMDQPPGTSKPTTKKAAAGETSNTKSSKKKSKNNTSSNAAGTNNSNSTKAKSAVGLVNMGLIVLLHLITDCSLT